MAELSSTRELSLREYLLTQNEGLFIDERWEREYKSKYVVAAGGRVYLRELMELRLWISESGKRSIQETWRASRVRMVQSKRGDEASEVRKVRLARRRYWMHKEWPAEYFDCGREWTLSNLQVVDKHINPSYVDGDGCSKAEATNTIHRWIIRQTWRKLPENSKSKMEIEPEADVLRVDRPTRGAGDKLMGTKSKRIWPRCSEVVDVGRNDRLRQTKASKLEAAKIPIMTFLTPCEWHYVKMGSDRWKGVPPLVTWESGPAQVDYHLWMNVTEARRRSTKAMGEPREDTTSSWMDCHSKKRLPAWHLHPYDTASRPVRRARR